MGVILDSTIVIAAERRRETAETLILNVLAITGDQPLALAAIGYTELVHGIYRIDTSARRSTARVFLKALVDNLPVLAYTKEIAELAGRIDAEQRRGGYIIPFADLLIGTTALHHGYAILTANVRHFKLIPNLEVIPFGFEA